MQLLLTGFYIKYPCPFTLPPPHHFCFLLLTNKSPWPCCSLLSYHPLAATPTTLSPHSRVFHKLSLLKRCCGQGLLWHYHSARLWCGHSLVVLIICCLYHRWTFDLLLILTRIFKSSFPRGVHHFGHQGPRTHWTVVVKWSSSHSLSLFLWSNHKLIKIMDFFLRPRTLCKLTGQWLEWSVWPKPNPQWSFPASRP